jgi:hypothetical protein
MAAMQNRRTQHLLDERQLELRKLAQQPRPEPHQLSPRSGARPNTAGQGTRPKVTCAMLNETERMLLTAPSRHKSMLSAGTAPRAANATPPPAAHRERSGVPSPVLAGLIFPTESAPSTGRPAERRPRPCSAAPHPAASPAAANLRRPHARVRRLSTPAPPPLRVPAPLAPAPPPPAPLARSPLCAPGCSPPLIASRSPLLPAGRPLAYASGCVGCGCGTSRTEAQPTPHAPRGCERRTARALHRAPVAPLDRQLGHTRRAFLHHRPRVPRLVGSSAGWR